MLTCKTKSHGSSQKEADSKLAIAEANAKVALYEALADVARTNPEQASVVVAMAVQGVGQESEAGDNRVVPLQPLQNEVEYGVAGYTEFGFWIGGGIYQCGCGEKAIRQRGGCTD